MLGDKRGPLWYRTDPHQTIRDLPGIGFKLAKRVVEDLGDGDPDAALVMIERNPFNLMEVEGIGFKKADRIAKEKFEVTPDDERRHEAGNRYILEQKGVLGERDFFSERIKLELRDPSYKVHGVEVEEGLYWLPEELEAEVELERWMRRLPTGEGEHLLLADLSPAQKAVLARMGADEQQTLAVRAILANRVLCFTGGAGTGKTFCVAGASQCAGLDRRSVRGMAFAGKAADRMREQFDRYQVMAEASTIHKALGFQKRGFTVERLAEDLYVIDEASMLPNWLLWAVVKRLPPHAHLILVGDPNQLPPIGYGTPFVDLLAHGVAHVHLEKNYRQADQQGILHMAEGILHRRRPTPTACVEMHLGVDPANLEPLFEQLVRTHGGQDFEDWQVITYQNENAERYNLRAQAVINPNGMPLFEYPLWKLGTGERNRPLYQAEIRVGDKIIVVKNSTLLNIFNGQTGRVIGMATKPKQVMRKQADGRWEQENGETMPHLRVEITGREVDIPEDEVEKYVQLGYVITVHKAQGSDWPRVIIMQPGKVRDDTARRFFYTAVTRAKDHLCVVSTLRVVAWWTNAATDAPDEPSSLLRRLARPAPCEWCGGEGCGICDETIKAANEAKWAAEGTWPDPAAQPDPWEAAEGETFWPEPAVAAALGPEPVTLERVEEIKAQFRVMDLGGVA
ncbi:AAA family ATPase [Deinococcus hopiensis]|uniref:Exodeoxyribonuclease V alpha subunit n=1 Tax=Deinococcus hopiensis KR-140 TaxID=695939 RepID=A0A1W1VKA8_9DEIO|nr:AAA family ATPase [Deinococcus hopiensis]SMB93374.1 exodeoxyribonuclease V alpha subunit [Deinococcus hopiensis KR-140]